MSPPLAKLLGAAGCLVRRSLRKSTRFGAASPVSEAEIPGPVPQRTNPLTHYRTRYSDRPKTCRFVYVLTTTHTVIPGNKPASY